MPIEAAMPLVSTSAALASQGYAYLPAFSADATGAALLALARSLGTIYVPPDVDPDHPIIETHPTPDASPLAPFDRAEAIGWHCDFSTHAERPVVSLAYLARTDPLGPEHGAWRVVSVDHVLEHLRTTADGRRVVSFLAGTDLPYSFTSEGDPSFFRAIELRPAGRLGMRFYGRALRDGARLAYGSVPDEIEHAVSAVESAADHVGSTLAAPAGALLVTDNWHALHDRLPQTVGAVLPPRTSLLCFISALHEPLLRGRSGELTPGASALGIRRATAASRVGPQCR